MPWAAPKGDQKVRRLQPEKKKRKSEINQIEKKGKVLEKTEACVCSIEESQRVENQGSASSARNRTFLKDEHVGSAKVKKGVQHLRRQQQPKSKRRG